MSSTEIVVEYTLHEREHEYTTADPNTAEAYSRAGLRVTASIVHVTEDPR